jgi:hypothetical protein
MHLICSENEVKNRWYSAPMRRRLRSLQVGEHLPQQQHPRQAQMVLSDEDWLFFKIGCEYMRRVVNFIRDSPAPNNPNTSTSSSTTSTDDPKEAIAEVASASTPVDISIDTTSYRNPHAKDISLKPRQGAVDYPPTKRHRTQSLSFVYPPINYTADNGNTLGAISQPTSTVTSPLNSMSRSWKDFIFSNDLLLARDDLSPTTSSTVLTWEDLRMRPAAVEPSQQIAGFFTYELQQQHRSLHGEQPHPHRNSSSLTVEEMSATSLNQTMGLNSDDIEALASMGWNDSPAIQQASSTSTTIDASDPITHMNK